MPVSIGIARTKTLAKMASKYAKRYPGYKHCCVIDTEEQRTKALRLFPVKDVWGIGRRWAEKLASVQIESALDFADAPLSYIRAQYNIVAERTWRELNGEDCIPIDDMDLAEKKSMTCSRSFPGMITDLQGLRTHVANYASKCAERLRRQHSVAGVVGVFIDTNRFREDLPQYGMFRMAELPTPTNSTQTIVACALRCLDKAFIQGYHYKRAGVMVMQLSADCCIQTSLADYDPEKYKKMRLVDATVDKLNRLNGRETIVLGAQQYTAKDGKGKAKHFADAIRRDRKSPNYTTRWEDIINVNC